MIGDIFKEHREKLGLDLEEAAQTLKIRREYLKALEGNSFGKLPPDVYTTGYIREYANFLGIDPEPLLKAYVKERAPTEQNKEVQPKSHQPKKGFNHPLTLLIASILVIFTASILAYYKRTSKGEGENSKTSYSDKNASSPAATDKKYSLRITAVERTWLRIELTGDKPEEVLLKPGDSKEWTSKDGFYIKIGNAGGVNAILDGKDIGKLGKRGQVLKIRLPKEGP